MRNGRHSDHKPASSSDNSESPSFRRRRALKQLAAGGAVAGAVAATIPTRWTRPVVQSVVLPAHAQTSPGDVQDGTFATRNIARSPTWLDFFIPTAKAVLPPQCGFEYGCARAQDNEIVLFLVFSGGGDVACYRSGPGQLGETVSFTHIEGKSVHDLCDIPTVKILSLEGDTPNRTLVISDGLAEIDLVETGGDCSCGDVPL